MIRHKHTQKNNNKNEGGDYDDKDTQTNRHFCTPQKSGRADYHVPSQTPLWLRNKQCGSSYSPESDENNTVGVLNNNNNAERETSMPLTNESVKRTLSFYYSSDYSPEIGKNTSEIDFTQATARIIDTEKEEGEEGTEWIDYDALGIDPCVSVGDIRVDIEKYASSSLI